MIEPRLAYTYAEIDPTLDNMCIGVHTYSYEYDDPCWIPIPIYDEEYILKYYINGSWYEDAAGTIPWTSSLL